MAEKIVERRAEIVLTGVQVFGATIFELKSLQSLLGGDGNFVDDTSGGDPIISKPGVSKMEVAELVESVMDISVKGLKELQDKLPQKHQQRYPYGEKVKTRRGYSRGKAYG